MTDRPILFSGPMVRALLDGRKTQTRRALYGKTGRMVPLASSKPGDRLYVREAIEIAPAIVWYAADREPLMLDEMPDDWTVTEGKMPGMFMPRWASRLTLIVERIRLQPLQAITDEDAIAEGIVEHETCGWHIPGLPHPIKEFPIFSRPTARKMYAALWDTLHGSGEWLGNPEVLALDFRIEHRNIDRLAA